MPDLGRRPTIDDLAGSLGLAKSTVSAAVNDRPGVSPTTRERIKAAAAELGWVPSSAARTLSGQRTGVVGFVLARSVEDLACCPFFMQLIAGIEAGLAEHGVSLLLQLATDHDAEVRTIEGWHSRGQVDGVLLTDFRVTDRRLERVRTLALPAVGFGLEKHRAGVSAVFCDEAESVRETVRYLARTGHQRLARVAGRQDFVNTGIRTTALLDECRTVGVAAQVVSVDRYTDTAGAEATRHLLAQPEPPTAVLYESEILAAAGNVVAREMGVEVPTELSIVAIGDSPVCTTSLPQLTSLRRDVVEFGRHGAAALMRLLDTERAETVQTAMPTLIPRQSTARAPRLLSR